LDIMLLGQKVILTHLEEEHLARTLKWITDPEVVHFTGPLKAVTRSEQKAWFDRISVSERDFVFTITAIEQQEPIGLCGLFDIHPIIRKGELRIRIGEREYWGRGYGSEAVSLLVKHGFEDLNLHRISASVFLDNERAVRCYRSLGFQEEGRTRHSGYIRGRYVDELILAVVRD
jgi:RimJ/RimL family protein N-acetyltransferase